MFGFLENLAYTALFFLFGGSANDASVELYLSKSRSEWMIPVRHGNHSLIDRSKDIVFFIHGFNEQAHYKYFYELHDALIKRGANAISVDWQALAEAPNYVAATKNVEVLAKFLVNYITQLGLDPARIHVVGFSLGAHIAGLAGRMLKKKGKLLDRITGLDPAGPMYGIFESVDVDRRLAPDDARVVVALHTNRALYGTAFDLAKVNFYANNGLYQPGCIREWLPILCSHRRSVLYFTESVNSEGFVADRIDGFSLLSPVGRNRSDHLVFGMNIPSTVSGKFYFATNEEKPFAQN